MVDYWENWHRRQLSRRRLLSGAGAAGLGAAALLVTGCGDDDDDDSAGSSSPTTAAGGTTAPTTPKGTLTIAPEGGTAVLGSFNPLETSTGYQIPYIRALADAPLSVDRDSSGKRQITPQLAASYEVTPDGLQLTYKLRNDAKFHDGSPVTAEDVAFTFEYLRSDQTRSTRKAEWTTVMDSVSTPDAQSVVLKLKQPYPQQLISNGQYWSTISKAAFNAGGFDGFGKNPIAAGPFKFVDGTLGERVRLTAVEGHYRKTPFVKDLNIIISPEEATRVAQIQTGELDITYIQPASKAAVQGIPGAKVVTFAEDYPVWLVFRDGATGNPSSPTTNILVRRAMSMAVNRKTITQNILSGDAVPSGTISLPRIIGHTDIAAADYNIDQAKALLSQAGFPNGFKIDLRTDGKAEYVDVMVADWKKIGVDVNVIVLDGAAWTALVTKDKTVGGMHIQPLRAAVDPANWAVFIRKSGVINYLPESVKEKTEPLMTSIIVGSNESERGKAWGEVQKLIADDLTYCSLWHPASNFAVSAKVAAWDPIPDTSFILRSEYAQKKA
jgi:peptide/nickel transport system substrate-binding protein